MRFSKKAILWLVAGVIAPLPLLIYIARQRPHIIHVPLDAKRIEFSPSGKYFLATGIEQTLDSKDWVRVYTTADYSLLASYVIKSGNSPTRFVTEEKLLEIEGDSSLALRKWRDQSVTWKRTLPSFVLDYDAAPNRLTYAAHLGGEGEWPYLITGTLANPKTHILRNGKPMISPMYFSPDGQTIVSNDLEDHWDFWRHTGQKINRQVPKTLRRTPDALLPYGNLALFGFYFGPKGEYSTKPLPGAYPDGWELVQFPSGKVIKRFLSPDGMEITCSSDSRTCALETTQGITLYHLPEFKRIKSLTHFTDINHMSLSPKGDQLAVSSEGTVTIYDVP